MPIVCAFGTLPPYKEFKYQYNKHIGKGKKFKLKFDPYKGKYKVKELYTILKDFVKYTNTGEEGWGFIISKILSKIGFNYTIYSSMFEEVTYKKPNLPPENEVKERYITKHKNTTSGSIEEHFDLFWRSIQNKIQCVNNKSCIDCSKSLTTILGYYGYIWN